MTARDLVKASLRLIGAIATGETPSADESADALAALNRMLGSWSTDSLMCIAVVEEEFTLTVTDSVYTMGDGGDFDTDRPLEIVKATIKDTTRTPAIEHPLSIVNVEQWADITQKQAQSTFPSTLYAEGTNPLETLNLYPVPTFANSIVLYSRKPITAIASLSTTITFPPGWDDALVNNLAIKLAPEFGKAVSPELAAEAAESKANIMRQNIRAHLLEADPALVRKGSAFNILTGGF